MVHKRSAEKLLKRRVRNLILDNSRRDPWHAETICLVSRRQVLNMLKEPVAVGDVPDVEPGEILTDSRGSGSLQRRVLFAEISRNR